MDSLQRRTFDLGVRTLGTAGAMIPVLCSINGMHLHRSAALERRNYVPVRQDLRGAGEQ